MDKSKSVIEVIKEILNNKLTFREACKKVGIAERTAYHIISKIKKSKKKDELEKYIDKYINRDKNCHEEKIDTIERAIINNVRDECGKIKSYNFKIFIKNKKPLIDSLSREEMEQVYKLYTFYGANLTQRELSRFFTRFSLIDFKRIIRALNITKSSSPFPQHLNEEFSNDELKELYLREKENNLIIKIEHDDNKDTKALLNKYMSENILLKKQIDNFINYKFDFSNIEVPIIEKLNIDSKNNLMLHLSDFHIGAKVESGSLYGENENFNEDELKRRLTKILEKVINLGKFDTIVINLLGDMIDGINQETARGGNKLPQNMDNWEQVNIYIRLIEYFVKTLIENKICNNIKIYSVRCGNHGGVTEYAATLAILAKLKMMFPNIIETKMFDNFFGHYKFLNKTFIITHGKDANFMFKGLPRELNDKTKIMLYEWLDNNKIYDDEIHIIKGDLHSNTIDSSKKLTYRNVLSLFGASDYSQYNFSRSHYGMSYELFINNEIVRGNFENV